MPVYKDSKRGTWYISHQVRDPITGKSKTTKKRGYLTKKEAIRAEKELFLDPTSSAITVRELIPLWEDYHDSSKQSRARHSEHFKYRLNECLDLPVTKVSKPVLSRLRANLAKDDRYSTTTKNQAISAFRSLLRFGHDVYDLPDNSAVLTRLKKTDEEVMKEFEVWTVEEFNTFIKYVNPPYYQLFYFLFWTGCRRGEAIALQKKDVSDHEAVIKYSQKSLREGLKPTKKRNIRTVRLDNTTWSIIEPLLHTEGSYVFGGETGLSAATVYYYFMKAVKESGVKKIRIHDLRHSHASWLINNGVNIVAVSKRLGHKDISTTLNTYTHLLESTDNDMMTKLNHANIMPQETKSLYL